MNLLLNYSKAIISDYKIKIQCYFYRLLSKFKIYKYKNANIQFISEKQNWAIKRVGYKLNKEISNKNPLIFSTSNKPYLMINKLVHFGSQYMWLKWGKHLSKSNVFVTSFFHGKPSDGPEVERHIDQFLSSQDQLSKVVTSCSIVNKRLIKLGFPSNKLITIPIGVDTKLFTPSNLNIKSKIRKKLGIDEDIFLIGSFQKDGIGWREGNLPKLIKGPDLFIDTLKSLKKTGINVGVLLTGPARGFVKRGLEENSIPYIHLFVKDKNQLVDLYRALDIYLITSREEGGPMGLMESMASGVPVISTKVGMAYDLIIDNKNGFLANQISKEDILEKINNFTNLKNSKKKEIILNAREKVLSCDWSIVAEKHMQLVYEPLIEEMK